MRVFISMRQLCLVLFWITTMVPQSLSQLSTDVDEEEPFVREMVAKMMSEDNHPLKTNKDALDDVSRRLKIVETRLEETTKEITANRNEMASVHRMLATLSSGQANLSATLESIADVSKSEQMTNTSETNLSITERVTPFDYGGVFNPESSGVLEFEAPYSLPYASTCVWTLRVDHYPEINITVLEENFGTSKSKLRLMSMNNMLWNSYTGNSSSLDIQEWASSSGGSSKSYFGPVVFVELVMQGRASTPPRFHLSFVGDGDLGFWADGPIGAAHFTKANGTISHKYRNSNDHASFVILPKSPYPRNVTLIPGIMNLKNCTNCGCGFIRIWKIGSQKLLGSNDAHHRFCGQSPNFHEEVDNVGWIIVGWSDTATTETRDFSIDWC